MCESVTWNKETPPFTEEVPERSMLEHFDSIDDETLTRLIHEFGLDVRRELPELKDLQITLDMDEQPER